jgi:hypothetical protein
MTVAVPHSNWTEARGPVTQIKDYTGLNGHALKEEYFGPGGHSDLEVYFDKTNRYVVFVERQSKKLVEVSFYHIP